MAVEIALFTITWSTFLLVDLLAASTNAFNGALLCRRPDHYRNFTIVGIILIAIIGGIAGGVARDVLLNDVPSAFTNPWYLILCVVAAGIALVIHFRAGQRFREGLFQFMTAFSLPWYAVVGADKALSADLPAIAAIAIGVIGPTAGRYMIDVISNVTPKHFVRGEWFVGTAILTSVVYVVCYWAGISFVPATLISFAVGFSFRIVAMWYVWEEPEPTDQPKGDFTESERKSIKVIIKKEREEAMEEKEGVKEVG